MSSDSTSHSHEASSVSFDDYDRFFDAQMDLSNDTRLPQTNDSPTIYSLPLDDRQAPASKPVYKVNSQIFESDFEAHHSAHFYPHVHQPLKTSSRKIARKAERRRRQLKEKHGPRPSHQYLHSLHQVAEQTDSSTSSSASSDDILWFGLRRDVEDSHPTQEEPLSSERLPDAAYPGDPSEQESDEPDGSSVLVVPSTSPNDPESFTGEPQSANSGEGVRFGLGDQSEDSMKGMEGHVLSALPGHIKKDDDSPTRSISPVTFTIGVSSSSAQDLQQTPASAGDAKPYTTGLRNRSISYDPGQDLSLRRRPGSEVELSTLTRALHKVPSITTPDEAALLNALDLEDLASHRFENVRGIRRHKIRKMQMDLGSHKHVEFQKSNLQPDHTPHELFIEMDELVTKAHSDAIGTELWEWKEKARWIKFEEDVLDSAGRWGRPHVPSLSFHSLIELRHLLENGLVSLDLDVHSYLDMMEKIVQRMISSGQLAIERKEYVMNALLLRHSHLDGKANFLRNRSYGNLKGLESLSRHARSSSSHPINNNPNPDGLRTCEHITLENLEEGQDLLDKRTTIEDQAEKGSDHSFEITREKYNLELLKKIPAGAETVSVLVGTLKGLERPTTAFVRLSSGVQLPHLAEVPLPVRFLFLCIGPAGSSVDYVEVGRSLSTLMSNESFRCSAYSTRDRKALLTAMNSFLDDSIVLPPGEFDRKTLLPIMYMAKQKLDKAKEQQKERERRPSQTSEDEKSDEDDPLRRTRKPFGGLVNDVKRRYPAYLSDLKDGLNFQVVAAFIFIYFACLAPAITFGGLLGEKTGQYMGASEMLLATTIAGIVFAFFSGQPLLITGFTGPLMVFEEGIFQFAIANGIDFLAWRLWVGCWLFVISIVLVACEASFLVRYVSRFTQEIFSLLISLIFIYEVFVKLVTVFRLHPLCEDYESCKSEIRATLNDSATTTPIYNITTMLPVITSKNNTTMFSSITTLSPEVTTIDTGPLIMQPNTALLSMTLTLFTFTIAYYLKELRNKKLLGRTMRRALGDFGVPIAILIMCVVDLLIGDKVFTKKLTVPTTFSVTNTTLRGWLVNPLGTNSSLPIAHIFSAALPALLGSILIFMETLIAGMIVNKTENKLKKGTGFHLDILILGFLALINGFIGLPFVCCATVRSVTHTSALTVLSKNNAPGVQQSITGVVEQRVSNIMVHILIGASMFLGFVLQYIPVAVLFGVFLYMGVASLGGIQLYQRIVLLLTPPKHHPLDVCYVRHVRMWKMHAFTAIQILCVGLLWGVKLSPGSLAFPFVLILLVPLRIFAVKHLFTGQELSELDKSGSCVVLAEAQQDDEPDFYETAHMPD